MKNKELLTGLMSGYRKEAVYDYYLEMSPDPKDYEKITRKKMVAEIFEEIEDNFDEVMRSLPNEFFEFILEVYRHKGKYLVEMLEAPRFIFNLKMTPFIYVKKYKAGVVIVTIADFFKTELKEFFDNLDMDEYKRSQDLRSAVTGYLKSVGVVPLDDIKNTFYYQFGFDKSVVEQMVYSLDSNLEDGIRVINIDFSDKKGVKAVMYNHPMMDILLNEYLDQILFTKRPDYSLKTLVSIGRFGYDNSNEYIVAFKEACDMLPSYLKEEFFSGGLDCVNFENHPEDFFDYLEEELSDSYISASVGVRLTRTFLKMFPNAPSITYSGLSRIEYSMYHVEEQLSKKN